MIKLTTLQIKATGKHELMDSDLFLKLDVPENLENETSGPVSVDVFELNEDMASSAMFTNPESQALTQGQVLEFLNTHKVWLRQNSFVTFFLIKSDTEFQVLGVFIREGTDKLIAKAFPLSSPKVWNGVNKNRVVIKS